MRKNIFLENRPVSNLSFMTMKFFIGLRIVDTELVKKEWFITISRLRRKNLKGHYDLYLVFFISLVGCSEVCCEA